MKSISRPRKVILVSMAIDGTKYRKISSGLAFLGVNLSPKPSDIDWEQEKIIKNLPEIAKSGFHFGVHYAMVVMDQSIYYDEKKDAMQKLMEATVFEHVGGNDADTVREGDRRKLDEAAIRSIYVVQVVGVTSCSDQKISKKYYRPLMSMWTYLPLWWNCHDLAVRLVYLLVAGNPRTPKSKKILTSFLVNLKRSLVERVTSKLKKPTTLLTGFGVICILGMLCPVAVGVGMLPQVPVLALAGIATATAGTYYAAERGAKAIYKFMVEIQRRFPILKQLHKEMRLTFDNMEVLHKNPASYS